MRNWSRLKAKINLVIDGIMFIVIMVVAGLGFLMKWVLLPGHRINEVYGTNTDLLFWGLDRHQWGAIHLYLALLLVFLLVLHIVLHWDMIVCIFRQMIPSKVTRWIIASALGVLGFFLALSPLNIKPEIVTLQRSYRNRVPERSLTDTRAFESTMPEEKSNDAVISTEPQTQQLPEISASRSREAEKTGSEPDRLHVNQADIDGTMTLGEISARYNISINELAKVINVPAQYANERLGRLKRIYGFEMDDLREFVSAGRENN